MVFSVGLSLTLCQLPAPELFTKSVKWGPATLSLFRLSLIGYQRTTLLLSRMYRAAYHVQRSHSRSTNIYCSVGIAWRVWRARQRTGSYGGGNLMVRFPAAAGQSVVLMILSLLKRVLATIVESAALYTYVPKSLPHSTECWSSSQIVHRILLRYLRSGEQRPVYGSGHTLPYRRHRVHDDQRTGRARLGTTSASVVVLWYQLESAS